MKRDWDLLRWILHEVELCPGGYPLVLTTGIYNGPHCVLNIENHDFAEVCEHILLLGDENLAEVRNLGWTMSGPAGVAIDRLTMAGHNFLDSARDETLWREAMEIIDKKGGGAVTIGILIQILSALIKHKLGMS